MPTLLNTSLFIHRETRTNGFNNLLCLAHPVTEAGAYEGDVYMQKTFLGRFRLNCEASSANQQVNIDLSHFDPLLRHRYAHLKVRMPAYSLAPDGLLLVHATEHHDGLYVVLAKVNEARVFDSRKLMKEDIIMLRPAATGDFLLRDEGGKQAVKIHVHTAEEKKYYHPSKLEPVMLMLSDKGFSESAVAVQPFQLIVVGIEVDGVVLEMVEV